jgi:hypothetical protein
MIVRMDSSARALLLAMCGLVGAATVPSAAAQAPASTAQPAQPATQPAATPAAQPATQATSQPLTEMENLVGRIALYPDDLLSVVLPASTFPLQIVEADRWIAQNKGNKDAKPKETWDDSIKAMINYPDVVTMMSNDLDWTSALGEAVAADQTAVMDAVQSFRRKAEGAGNLMSDDKQTVVVEEDVVKIVQTDPQVIYVPQYEPQVIVVQQPAPVPPIYYPTPYPCYWYPYPPGYSFAAGFFWGATVAWAFDWHGGGIYNDVNINIDRGDINIDRNTNISGGDRNTINNRPTNVDRAQSQQRKAEGRGSWQSGQSPSNVRQGRAPSASTGAIGGGGSRPTAGTGAAGGAGSRPSAGTGAVGGGGSRPSAGTGASASTRPSSGSGSLGGGTTPRTQPSTANSSGSRYSNTSRNASTARSSTPSNDAFSGMSNGRSVSAQSSRGYSSRSSGGFSGASRGGGGARGGGGRR